MTTVADEWGGIDVYFFDQVLRGRVRADVPFLDAGCGAGRNLLPLLARGYDGYGCDQDAAAVAEAGRRALDRGLNLGAERLSVCSVEQLASDDESFGFVLSNAVLHFARDEAHFAGMVDEMYRVLRPGGVLFARLASSIGLEERVQRESGRWHRLPDGSRRFLVDLDFLRDHTRRLGAEFIDPIKTVNVEDLRCMTNWCLRKP